VQYPASADDHRETKNEKLPGFCHSDEIKIKPYILTAKQERLLAFLETEYDAFQYSIFKGYSPTSKAINGNQPLALVTSL